MHFLSHALFGLTLGLGLASCSQTICQNGSNGSCEDLAAGGSDASADVQCEDPNLTSCDSQCVDTDIDPSFCGDCNTSCDTGQGCSAGACVDICDTGEVLCQGNCIDPTTNGNFCGASATCFDDTAGEDCQTGTCVGGSCVAAATYIGSLTPAKGKWSYGNEPGVAGAQLACRSLFGSLTATVCSPAQLVLSQSRGELANAKDSAGDTVTSWFIVDPNANGQALQCIHPDSGGVPWTYETHHLGEGAQFITVNASGTISEVQDAPVVGNAGGCEALRNVACCNP